VYPAPSRLGFCVHLNARRGHKVLNVHGGELIRQQFDVTFYDFEINIPVAALDPIRVLIHADDG
jgi:hypothetical protein